MNERVTLADIARDCGCARSTVSMALRGNHAIPLTTREKIIQSCQRLGYKPNALLASLASHRFRSTKKIFDIPIAFFRTEPPQMKEWVTLDSAQKLAPALGYKVTSYSVEELAAMRDPSRVLYHRGIQGIILPNFFDPSSLPMMDWTPFSVVALGHPLEIDAIWAQTGFHRVTTDHYEAVASSWRRAVKLGYERIGVVLFHHHPVAIRDDELRRAAWLFCQEGIPRTRRIPLQEFHFDETAKLGPWLKRYQPDVVIGMTPAVWWWIRDADWRVPEDVAFISLHKSDPETYAENKSMAGLTDMTGSEVPVALELLDRAIRLSYRGLSKLPQTVLLHPPWRDGPSLPDRRALVRPPTPS